MAQRIKRPKAEPLPPDPTTEAEQEAPAEERARLQCSWCGRTDTDVTKVKEYCGVLLPNRMECTGTLQLFSPQKEQRGGCCAKGCSMAAAWLIEWDEDSEGGYTLACQAHVGDKLQALRTNTVSPLT